MTVSENKEQRPNEYHIFLAARAYAAILFWFVIKIKKDYVSIITFLSQHISNYIVQQESAQGVGVGCSCVCVCARVERMYGCPMFFVLKK